MKFLTMNYLILALLGSYSCRSVTSKSNLNSMDQKSSYYWGFDSKTAANEGGIELVRIKPDGIAASAVNISTGAKFDDFEKGDVISHIAFIGPLTDRTSPREIAEAAKSFGSFINSKSQYIDKVSNLDQFNSVADRYDPMAKVGSGTVFFALKKPFGENYVIKSTLVPRSTDNLGSASDLAAINFLPDFSINARRIDAAVVERVTSYTDLTSYNKLKSYLLADSGYSQGEFDYAAGDQIVMGVLIKKSDGNADGNAANITTSTDYNNFLISIPAETGVYIRRVVFGVKRDGKTYRVLTEVGSRDRPVVK